MDEWTALAFGLWGILVLAVSVGLTVWIRKEYGFWSVFLFIVAAACLIGMVIAGETYAAEYRVESHVKDLP